MSKKIDKSARPHCMRGCGAGKPGAKYCTACGAAYYDTLYKSVRPIVDEPLPFLGKSAAASPSAAPAVDTVRNTAPAHWARLQYDDDPAIRELAFEQIYGPHVKGAA